jgi:hypothetical protein
MGDKFGKVFFESKLIKFHDLLCRVFGYRITHGSTLSEFFGNLSVFRIDLSEQAQKIVWNRFVQNIVINLTEIFAYFLGQRLLSEIIARVVTLMGFA